MTPISPSARSVPWWLGILVVLGAWLLARPYVGLRHDGVIYTAQALLHLFPDVMSRDLFFQFGSQDSFTLFGRLLALMYARWDLAGVQILVLAACQLALMWAVFELLRPLADDVQRWMGLVALAVCSHVYGGAGLIAFAERFVTARTPAEPVLMWSLVLLVRGRLVAAAAMALLAALLHPLMTFPVMIVAWIVLLQRDRRWAWAAALLLIPVGLALAGIGPFDRLLQTYDDEWWALVLSSSIVFPLGWQSPDWQIIVLDLGLLSLASLWVSRHLVPLCRALVAATVLLFAVTIVGGDLLRNVFISQVQLWRVMWVVHVMALALLPALLLHAWRQAALGRLLAVALACAFVAVNARWSAGWAFMAWAVFVFVLLRQQVRLSPSFAHGALGVTLFGLLGLSGAVLAGNLYLVQTQQASLDGRSWLLLAATLPTLSMALAALVLWSVRQGRAVATLAVLLAAAGAAYGAAAWDRRSAWTHFIETGLHREHPFARHIPKEAQVYWHDTTATTWVLLRRASHYSLELSSALLFSRPMALETERRKLMYRALNMQDDVCAMTNALGITPGGDGGCSPTEEIVEGLCREKGGPDFTIFRRKLPRGLIAEWTFDAPAPMGRTLYLYDCSQFR